MGGFRSWGTNSMAYNKRAYGKRSELLRRARERYPYRLVRNHNPDPSPTTIDPETWGHFYKSPAPDGDEWLFAVKESRDQFIRVYGGTILGE